MGVSCIYCLNDYIWSTGRDGFLRQFYLNKNENDGNYKLTPVSVDKLTIPWAAKIINTVQLGILIFGFHEVS